MEYTYDAFISYRHLPADMAVAEKLQALLESRKKKDGTKISVFRDKSDLPTSSDLGADICANLEQSRFLIVVCSPAYQQSKWCMKELEYFRQIRGDNRHILPILVEGEPDDVFPEILRFDWRMGWDESGNSTMLWTEVEPLGADVRGNSPKERMRKLRVEYLRIAAPILGVTFDQLYQRALRKKRTVTALVIAGLVAFGVYSSILITQITQRQKQLTAKQQELYQNESVRLANVALELTGDNLPLAMLLADTALPADLENPEYPLTEEAELAVNSTALQHQIQETSGCFTPTLTVDLQVSRWTVGYFYDNGNYFTLTDYNETWLYEAHTGKLTANIPGYGYYFFDGVNRYGELITTRDAEGRMWNGCVIFDTATGEELNRVEGIAPEGELLVMLADPRGGKLWALCQHVKPRGEDRITYTAYGWIDADGNYTVTQEMPDYLVQFCAENGVMGCLDNPYIYPDGATFAQYMNSQCETMPQAYRNAYETFAQQNRDLQPYGFSVGKDGKIGMIHYQNEDFSTGVALWSLEKNRLLFRDDGSYYLEKDSGLVYHHLPNRLEVLRINTDVVNRPIQKMPYSYVSPDGGYGIACYEVREAENTQGQSSVGVYSVEDPGICNFRQWFDIWYTEAASRTPIYESSLHNKLLCVSADGSRMAFLDQEGSLKVVDIPSGNVVAQLDYPERGTWALALNHTGDRLAYLNIDYGSIGVDVIDPDTCQTISTVTYAHDTIDPKDGAYLAISDEKALVAFYDEAFLLDLAHPQTEPEIIDLSDTVGYVEDLLFAQAFTGDGLVLIPGEEIAAQGVQRRIKKIYDLKTGKTLDFQNRITYNREDYYYDALSGNLILRYSNSFLVQRRGEDGNFQEVYTITPRHYDMELRAAGHSTDGTWLVLQNEEYCEIYRLADGKLCYMIRKPEGRSSQMAVIDGQLYDFCAGGNLGISLPSAGEARDYIRETLVYEGVTRTLTDEEMREYYIPSQWREK